MVAVIGGQVDRHSVIVRRAPLVDDGRGNEMPDWNAAVDIVSPGWAIDTSGSADDTANRDGASNTYTLRGPFAADVRATDRVVLFGEVFLISGSVQRQPGVTAMTSHTLVVLNRWEG